MFHYKPQTLYFKSFKINIDLHNKLDNHEVLLFVLTEARGSAQEEGGPNGRQF